MEVAPPKAGEVHLKILYNSLCRTNIYFWEAKGQTPLFPRIFGHEAGGILESVGEGVTHLKPGDYAFPVFTGECGECPHCKLEERNMCDLFRINTDRGINPEAPLDKVCVLNCGICTCLGATINVAKPKPGFFVAIFGLGAVGLAFLLVHWLGGAHSSMGLTSSSLEPRVTKKRTHLVMSCCRKLEKHQTRLEVVTP
ncbi:hypothetical protein AHAS_Ahas09G0100500 [Arachis hypogaea]